MSKERNLLINKAKSKAKGLKKLREDKRYSLVLGRLKSEGLIEAKSIQAHRKKFLLSEALWVGENIEPRVLELLPAILLKKPSIILFEELPEDLKLVLNSIKQGRVLPKFRGIPGASYRQWVPLVGKKGGQPAVSKIFRFKYEEFCLLKELSIEMGLSESEVVKEGLKSLKKCTKCLQV